MARRVLITGARSAAAVDIARDFRRLGFEVHMADCVRSRMARASRAVTAVHAYPSPVQDPIGFRQAVLDLTARLDPVLVVPTCEEVFHLAGLALGPVLFQPPAATLRSLHDKGAFAALCGSAGLSAPETYAIDRAADLLPFRDKPDGWVFKARFSRFGEGTVMGAHMQGLDRVGPGWIAQQRIEGREVSFYAVARAGSITAFAAYDSDWRLPGGACLTFHPVEPDLDRTLFGMAETLAGATRLTGQFACDLIVDSDRRPWLIECNPRATSGAHLLVGDGRLARAMLGSLPAPVMAGEAPRHLLPAFATFGLAMAIRDGRLTQWVSELRAGQDVTGRTGDRAPLWGAALDGLAFVRLGRRLGISTAAATTADIEWNGEERP
jgi:hypothetical protein